MHSLIITNTTETTLNEALLDKVVHIICHDEASDSCTEISIHICGDDEMREFNKTYRGYDAITDILSFSTQSTINSTSEKAVPQKLCDIIIDINQLDRQKDSQSLDREILNVLIHGLLHCFDYDHIRSSDKIVMMQKETYYKNVMDGELTRG